MNDATNSVSLHTARKIFTYLFTYVLTYLFRSANGVVVSEAVNMVILSPIEIIRRYPAASSD